VRRTVLSAKATLKRLQENRHVDAAVLSEQHRFRHGRDVDADDNLVCELGSLARAHTSHVIGTAKMSKHAGDRGISSRVRAHKDREISSLCSARATRDRCVRAQCQRSGVS
jgi:hypothetical protein